MNTRISFSAKIAQRLATKRLDKALQESVDKHLHEMKYGHVKHVTAAPSSYRAAAPHTTHAASITTDVVRVAAVATAVAYVQSTSKSRDADSYDSGSSSCDDSEDWD